MVSRIASRRIRKVVLFAALLLPLGLRASDDETSLLIPVRQGEKFSYIDTDGKAVIGFQFDFASSFSEGLAQVQRDRKCGYIDRSGKLVIPYQRCYIFDDFHEGFAVVSFKRRGKKRFLDTHGRFLKGAEFAFADDFSEGLAGVKPHFEGECCWGYIGKDGRFVIPPRFENFAGRFSEGVAYVRLGGKVGFINKQGEFVIPPQYEQAEHFSEGLAPVRLNGKWGFIDHQGTFVVPPQFESARSFSDGLAVAYAEKDKAGYIDRQGHWVVEPKYGQTWPFGGGYGEVVSGWVGFVDTSGKEVLPVKYSEGSYLGEGWFRVLTANEEGMAEWRIMDVRGRIIYRYDARDPRCVRRAPPFPKEEQVSVTLTPTQATVRAGASIPFQVVTDGFTGPFFFSWGTRDTVNHREAHSCPASADSRSHFDSCPFGYLGEAREKRHGLNVHGTANYHAPAVPGTYYMYVEAWQLEGCGGFRKIERQFTATLAVTP